SLSRWRETLRPRRGALLDRLRFFYEWAGLVGARLRSRRRSRPCLREPRLGGHRRRDHDVAEAVESRGEARRDDGCRVVLVDDGRPSQFVARLQDGAVVVASGDRLEAPGDPEPSLALMVRCRPRTRLGLWHL